MKCEGKKGEIAESRSGQVLKGSVGCDLCVEGRHDGKEKVGKFEESEKYTTSK